MAHVKSTPYGQVRRTAYALWRGPDYLQNEDDAHPLSGLCILRLALRKGTSAQPLIEARAVYASLGDETQQDAVLRAVSWDSQVATSNSLQQSSQIRIPARFVQIPVSLLHQWTRTFDVLQTSIRSVRQQDDTLPICSLRIETDAVYSLFEKVWQVVESEKSELTRVWQEVWQHMGQALQTSPIVPAIKESFPDNEARVDMYDLQLYKPLLDLS